MMPPGLIGMMCREAWGRSSSEWDGTRLTKLAPNGFEVEGKHGDNGYYSAFAPKCPGVLVPWR